MVHGAFRRPGTGAALDVATGGLLQAREDSLPAVFSGFRIVQSRLVLIPELQIVFLSASFAGSNPKMNFRASNVGRR
jgi:hypothetical protein